MSNKKGSGMVIKNTGGGKDFDPDPVLDPKGDYEARIVGFMHIGVHEKDEWTDAGATGNVLEVEQAIVLFELTEEETFVDRGPEGAKVKARRIMPKFLKYSSHENSNLFEIASAANANAAYMEGKEGRVDPVEMIGDCVTLKLSLNKAKTKNNIKSAVAIPKKYKGDVPDMESAPFCYSVDAGIHVGAMEDVPHWMLNFAMTKALNAEQFEDAENLEAQIAKNLAAYEAAKAERDAKGKLAGDEKAKTKTKPDPEPEAEQEEVEQEEEVEKPVSTRKRRGSKKAVEVDYSDKTVEEMEDILIEKGVTDDELNDIADEYPDDDEYLEALIAKAKA